MLWEVLGFQASSNLVLECTGCPKNRQQCGRYQRVQLVPACVKIQKVENVSAIGTTCHNKKTATDVHRSPLKQEAIVCS